MRPKYNPDLRFEVDIELDLLVETEAVEYAINKYIEMRDAKKLQDKPRLTIGQRIRLDAALRNIASAEKVLKRMDSPTIDLITDALLSTAVLPNRIDSYMAHISLASEMTEIGKRLELPERFKPTDAQIDEQVGNFAATIPDMLPKGMR